MRATRLVAVAALVVLAASIAGCGSERVRPHAVERTFPPGGFERASLAEGDVRMPVPRRWTLSPLAAPGVVTLATGQAELTVWAYPSLNAVDDIADAELARAALLESLRERDPAFELQSSRVRLVAGAPAVEIHGRTRLAGRPLEVRSVHVYIGEAEYVIDALADPERFAFANEEVFREVLRGFEADGRPPSVRAPEREGEEPGATAAPTPEN